MALQEVLPYTGDNVDSFAPTEQLELYSNKLIAANWARVGNVAGKTSAIESLLLLQPPQQPDQEEAKVQWTWQLTDIDLANRQMLDTLYESLGVDTSESKMTMAADGVYQNIKRHHYVPGGLRIVESLTVIDESAWKPPLGYEGPPDWSEYRVFVTTPDIEF